MPRKKKERSSVSRLEPTLPFLPSNNIWQGVMRPSEIIEDIMAGRVDLEDQSPMIQSATSLQIYHVALDILGLPVKERLPAIEKFPVLLQPHIKKEVRRIWEIRES